MSVSEYLSLKGQGLGCMFSCNEGKGDRENSNEPEGDVKGWDCGRTGSNIKTDFYTQQAIMAITGAGQGRAMTELTSLKHRRRGRGLQPVEACKRLLVAPSVETRLSPMRGICPSFTHY